MFYSVTLSTFTLLCKHHHHPSLEFFSSSKLKLCAYETNTLLSIQPNPAPSNSHPSTSCFYVFDCSSDQIRSVAQSCPTLRPHESQHARPACPSPTPRVHPDSRPLRCLKKWESKVLPSCDWLPSFCIMSLVFIHVVACVRISFLFIAK